eukprot:1449425-Rhodomonas_salina.1
MLPIQSGYTEYWQPHTRGQYQRARGSTGLREVNTGQRVAGWEAGRGEGVPGRCGGCCWRT